MKSRSGVLELLLVVRLESGDRVDEGEFLQVCLPMCTNGRVVYIKVIFPCGNLSIYKL
jgi:hypothetical protein